MTVNPKPVTEIRILFKKHILEKNSLVYLSGHNKNQFLETHFMGGASNYEVICALCSGNDLDHCLCHCPHPIYRNKY